MKASTTLHAPAKLNLTLEVLNRRPDGLHALRSVMVPVDLCDEIHIEPAEDALAFTCDPGQLTLDNLVERAIRALDIVTPLRVALTKRVPTGAGLGGGSSDAAAIFIAAQRGLLGPVTSHDYVALARSIGSDVPFFLAQTMALVEGTGERVTALGAVPPWHAVVIKPPVSVSTAWAYGRIDAAARESRPRNASAGLLMSEALQRADFDRVLELLQNDFHDVLAPSTPEIREALSLLAQADAPRPMLTGSGSCVFALARTLAERDTIAQRITPKPGYDVYTCAFLSGETWRRTA